MKDILIVEDQQGERDRLQKIFEKSGYTVEASDSALAAERLLSQSKFRLAILDIGLGDKSGSHLFHEMKRANTVAYIIIFTGNPSVHLKQRFISEGAVDYIVKGSSQAQGDKLLARAQEILGTSIKSTVEGIPLVEFLDRYVDASCKKLFQNMDGSLPVCKSCGQADYVVTFSGSHQLPPDIVGKVKCQSCGAEMDPEIA